MKENSAISSFRAQIEQVNPSEILYPVITFTSSSSFVFDQDVARILQKIFSEHDADNSGTMDMYELQSALEKQGEGFSLYIFRFQTNMSVSQAKSVLNCLQLWVNYLVLMLSTFW